MAICIEKPEDFKKEMSFDKFMDEILIKESAEVHEETEEEESYGRKIARRSSERPVNSIRFGR